MDVNTSLLDSSSVFIQLSEEEIAQQIVHVKSEMKSKASQEDEINIEKSEHSQLKSPLVPIQLTYNEAMRLLNLAASLLQANIKRYFQQCRYRKMLKEHKAAIKIQSLWRGYHTRCLNVKIFQKKHDYLLNYLQRQILDLDEKYTKKYDIIRNDRNLLVDVVFKLFDEVEELKNKLNVSLKESCKEGTFESNHSVICSDSNPSGTVTVPIISSDTADTIVSNTTKITENIIGKTSMEDQYVGDISTILTESTENSLDSLNDTKNYSIEDIANSIVDTVLIESIIQTKEILNQDAVKVTNETNEVVETDSSTTDVVDMTNSLEINPGDSLDVALKDVANLDSIEIDIG